MRPSPRAGRGNSAGERAPRRLARRMRGPVSAWSAWPGPRPHGDQQRSADRRRRQDQAARVHAGPSSTQAPAPSATRPPEPAAAGHRLGRPAHGARLPRRAREEVDGAGRIGLWPNRRVRGGRARLTQPAIRELPRWSAAAHGVRGGEAVQQEQSPARCAASATCSRKPGRFTRSRRRGSFVVMAAPGWPPCTPRSAAARAGHRRSRSASRGGRRSTWLQDVPRTCRTASGQASIHAGKVSLRRASRPGGVATAASRFPTPRLLPTRPAAPPRPSRPLEAVVPPGRFGYHCARREGRASRSGRRRCRAACSPPS